MQLVQSLSVLDLNGSANFEENNACTNLGLLLSSAPALRKVDIGDQLGNQKISVSLKYATEAEDGTITNGRI